LGSAFFSTAFGSSFFSIIFGYSFYYVGILGRDFFLKKSSSLSP
jgi:hypothetical protein